MLPIPYDLKDISSRIRGSVIGSNPFFLSRLGGSDTNALIDFLGLTGADDPLFGRHIAKHIPIVKSYNGFYSFCDETSDYIQYLGRIQQIYEQSSFSMACNFQFLSIMFPDSIHPKFVKHDFDGKSQYIAFVNHLLRQTDSQKKFFPYGYVERFLNERFGFFRDMESCLAGKRVLVLSPFSESIHVNFPNRSKFFRNYVYPDFELLTVTTPITYSGLPRSFYPNDSWAETVESLSSQIASVPFDIALMSCGSYALPLGDFIHRVLGRSAIYVGGMLQLFFGIMGRRYQDDNGLLSHINADSFIYPLERGIFESLIKINPDTAKEAFGAYF
jgi:hypothetical protein